MQTKVFQFLILFLMSFLLACSNCNSGQSDDSSSTTNTSPDNEPTNFADAMKKTQEAMEQLQSGEKVEPINFRELQDFTPEKLSGMKRVSKSGQTSGFGGFSVSTAEAEYEDSDGNIVKVEIMDTGGIAMAAMSLAQWTNLTIDQEDENGFERTSTLSGHKTFEQYRKGSNRTSEVSAWVGNRFIVKASGRNQTVDNLRDVVKDVGLKDLAKKGK